jgi:hypothetical protein
MLTVITLKLSNFVLALVPGCWAAAAGCCLTGCLSVRQEGRRLLLVQPPCCASASCCLLPACLAGCWVLQRCAAARLRRSALAHFARVDACLLSSALLAYAC